jgi:hypothetical protein
MLLKRKYKLAQKRNKKKKKGGEKQQIRRNQPVLGSIIRVM